MKRDYIPDAGDIVWMDFDPQAGHEQAGHRPALVLSPAVYNGRIGLLLCCPMTTKIKVIHSRYGMERGALYSLTGEKS